MQIRIASDDGVPIYIQIVNQVKHLVASGRLAPGDEMPSIRVLAEQLTVNPNTVARAYLELEHTGIVTKRNGTGTYVSEVRTPMLQREKIKILSSRADALLTEARQLDVNLAEVIKLLHERDALMLDEEIGK
ncbi:MAG TPA: GntR family transcriptional regulator [Verrucomicrobiae bacterium]|jgi:GntR family transcriptional regulator